MGLLGSHLLETGVARLQGLRRFRVTSSAGLLGMQTLLGGACIHRINYAVMFSPLAASGILLWARRLSTAAEHPHQQEAGQVGPQWWTAEQVCPPAAAGVLGVWSGQGRS